MVSTPLKNISQNGNLPQIGGENKKYLKPPPSISLLVEVFNSGCLRVFCHASPLDRCQKLTKLTSSPPMSSTPKGSWIVFQPFCWEWNSTQLNSENKNQKRPPIFVTCHSLKSIWRNLPGSFGGITFPLLQTSFPHFLGTKSFRKNGFGKTRAPHSLPAPNS